ncbi:transporter substrate-binding domain-containing protein [Schumannella soli]|uniref:Amino acid ABC transporter substrate-binding protein n=1 Tax=Schumannella soli TaxID=2590779 RepID=A0A506XNJ3_9MICO|nr:transporter substrate-binding domain-containing protein [Schumannella soli]TPW74234.1 amino acid ABC transporter substrate-binding protein [Schumannella soli]
MNTALRPLAALVAVGIVAAALAGCSSSPASTVASDCKPADAGLTTFTKGTLTVGVPENMPYTKNEGSDASGIEIDLLKKMAKAECLDIAFVPITYANGIPMITEQKKTDVISGGWYVTADRAKQVGFTSPTMYDTMGIVSASGASTVKELESIGQVGSGAGFSWEKDMSAILGSKFTNYPGTIEMKQDMQSGRIKAALDGYAVAVAAYADTDFKVEPVKSDPRVAITTEKPQIAFPVDPDNTKLSDALSKLIDGYREDGTLTKLLADYDLPAELLVPADVAAKSIR